MKVVIDIGEVFYDLIKDGLLTHSEQAIEAIRNGVPLPKFKCVYDRSSTCDHKNCDGCQYMCIAKYEIESDTRKEQI